MTYVSGPRLFSTCAASGPGNTLGGFLHLGEGELLILLLMTRGLALQQKIALLIAGWSYALLLTHNLEAFLVVISLPSIPQK